MELRTPSKKGFRNAHYQPPLPIISDYPPGITVSEYDWPLFTGHYNGSSVIVDDPLGTLILTKKGFFGKGSLSRGCPNFGKRKFPENVVYESQWKRRKQWIESLNNSLKNKDNDTPGQEDDHDNQQNSGVSCLNEKMPADSEKIINPSEKEESCIENSKNYSFKEKKEDISMCKGDQVNNEEKVLAETADSGDQVDQLNSSAKDTVMSMEPNLLKTSYDEKEPVAVKSIEDVKTSDNTHTENSEKSRNTETLDLTGDTTVKDNLECSNKMDESSGSETNNQNPIGVLVSGDTETSKRKEDHSDFVNAESVETMECDNTSKNVGVIDLTAETGNCNDAKIDDEVNGSSFNPEKGTTSHSDSVDQDMRNVASIENQRMGSSSSSKNMETVDLTAEEGSLKCNRIDESSNSPDINSLKPTENSISIGDKISKTIHSGSKITLSEEQMNNSAMDIVDESKRTGIIDLNSENLTLNPNEVLVIADVESDLEQYFNNLNPHIDEEKIKTVIEVLYLSLEEAFFLSYACNCLQIFDLSSNVLEISDMWVLFQNSQADFIEKYVAYHYFRAKGWVVKSGTKFGGDFLLYKKGPLFFHASYIVIVEVIINGKNVKNNMTWNNVDGINRMANSAAKDIILCHVFWPTTKKEQFNDPSILKEFAVSETLLRKWQPKQEKTAVVV